MSVPQLRRSKSDWFGVNEDSALDPELYRRDDDTWDVHRPRSLNVELFGTYHTATLPRITQAEVRDRFQKLKDAWVSETRFSSSPFDKAMNMNYQSIIGLGPDVIPVIIDELREGPNHWFWALRALAQEDHGLGETTLEGAAKRWIQWFDKQMSVRRVS